MPDTFSGRCLCGAVSALCSAEPMMAGHCHCEDCRRSSGSGHCSHLGAPEESVTITGSTKAYERASDSGNMIARHFCPNCGSALFSKNAGMPGLLFLRASSLDDLEVFKPQMHVFVARAASWDRPASDIPTFEKMPPNM
ncbi:MAG: GFA family protein [Caulobacteraceae bacterium]|nr:GFA family protein [Caulobacteraceae bacterium]